MNEVEYYRYNYRNCVMYVEVEHDYEIVKRFHYVIDCTTGKQYPIDHSPYSDPTVEQFKASVDGIFRAEGR